MALSTTLTMSGLVFGGSSQFAVLELWHAPLPFMAIAIITLAVNARHIAFGAALHPMLAMQPPLRRYLCLAFLADANWASTQQAHSRGEVDAAHLLGGGILLWCAWLVGTWIGAAASNAFGGLERFGVDTIMPAFFVCALIGIADKPSDAWPWLAAGLIALGASLVMPIHWAIITGALLGSLCGIWRR